MTNLHPRKVLLNSLKALIILIAGWIAFYSFGLTLDYFRVYQATGGRSPLTVPVFAVVPLVGAVLIIVGLIWQKRELLWIGLIGLIVVSGLVILGLGGQFFPAALGLAVLIAILQWVKNKKDSS